MLFNIVKKDFILAKKYLILMFTFAVLGPIFIESRVGFIEGGFLSFFITAFFTQYMLFNSISMSEYKYNGSLHLCVTPYTRKLLVIGKYLFIIIVFTLNSFIYVSIALFESINIPLINISVDLPIPGVWTIGISLLIISTLFGALIPLQYQFGYEKTKYIAGIFAFVSPFVLPKIVQVIKSNDINLVSTGFHWNIAPYLLSLIIGVLSMLITTHIYSKKDLH